MALRRTPGPSRKELLKDEDLARWYKNVAQGSLITADVYVRRLGVFCDQMHTKPNRLAQLPQLKLRDLILDFVGQEVKKGRAGSYIASSVKTVKSWLLHNNVKLNLPIKIAGTQETPTLRDERTPTQDELRRILISGTLRARVSSSFMAFSGLRPEVLGNYLGSDGLRVRDMPELEIHARSVRYKQTPAIAPNPVPWFL